MSRNETKKQQLTLSKEDQQYLAEFERMLDLIRDRTCSVTEGYQSGCYLVGRPGASKTYTVKETLKGKKRPWAYRNSRMTPMGLYAFLKEHREHTIVLDDIPSLVDQRQALQILMAALGGEAGEPRPVTYTTKNKNERESFQFSGGIIAISNVQLRRDPLADAVASRVVRLEHEPTDELLIAFMRSQALKGYKKMTPAQCSEVVEFVIAEVRAGDYRLDLRHMTKAWEDFRLDKNGRARRSWQDLVRSSMSLIVKHDAPPLGRAEVRDRERQIALGLLRQYPGRRDKSQRDDTWKDRTGKSPDTLYRHKRVLKAEGLL